MTNLHRGLRVAFSCLLLLFLFSLAVVAAMAQDSPRVLNVMDYGAVGDGVTDDTAAINAAAKDLRDGETLYIPSGTYLLREYGEKHIILIEDKKNVHIRMDEGTVLQLYSGGLCHLQGEQPLHPASAPMRGLHRNRRHHLR